MAMRNRARIFQGEVEYVSASRLEGCTAQVQLTCVERDVDGNPATFLLNRTDTERFPDPELVWHAVSAAAAPQYFVMVPNSERSSESRIFFGLSGEAAFFPQNFVDEVARLLSA